jgi:beta-lactamase class A
MANVLKTDGHCKESRFFSIGILGRPARPACGRGNLSLGIKYFLFLFLLSFAFTSVDAQIKIDKVLDAKLFSIIKEFKGDVGIYVHNLKTGKIVAINADTLFPTASMIKIPIMVGVFDKIEKGELKYDSLLTYRDSLLYPGDDILGSLKDSSQIELSKVQMLSMTTSDNTASLWLQSLAGTGPRINDLMEQLGLKYTRMNSRTPGREQMQEFYGWGVTTPREMAELVVKIYQEKVVSPWASERMFRNMSRSYWDGEALSEIPPYVHAASKQGAVDESRSEVVLVNAPHGDYVFCVITKSQQDTSWTNDNEGYVLLRNVSRTLWHYFEPKDKWNSYKESLELYH